MINIVNFGNDIIIRGRDIKGNRYIKNAQQNPYFYIPSTEGQFTTIYGDTVRRVNFSSTGEVFNKRNNYRRTFEDNVGITTRYLIDNFTSIEEAPVRVCFLDIETEDRNGFPNPAHGDKQILSICCYDNFSEKYYIFLNSPNGKQDKRIENIDGYKVKILEHSNEIQMLGDFKNFVSALDFDVFYAWNGDFFDYPYILNRMRNLGIEPEELSPYGKISKDFKQKIVDEKTGQVSFKMRYGMPIGRSFLDLMEAYKKLSIQKMESYSLDYVSMVEINSNKIEHSEKIGEMWENNLSLFLKYNLHDVILMVKIENKKGITAYFDAIRRMTFCNWEDIFFNSKVLDSFMLKKAHEMNVILPSRNYNVVDEEKVEGAIVDILKVGVTENVAVADVKSLYPSAMETCNMSPETIIQPHELDKYDEYCKVDDVYFRMDKRGFIPTVIRDLWDLRQEYKNKMRQCKFGSDEYNKWNNIQTVCKFLLNSIYGVMKFKSFRLYNRNVFKSVTYFGRKNNLFMQDIVKETGHDLVLYDTDSNDFKLNSKTFDDMVAEAKSVIDLMNNRVESWVEENFGCSKFNCVEIEFEKIYGALFTTKNEDNEVVKKRYAGLIIYDDGKDLREEPELIVMGFGGKRSDTPLLFKNLQKEIFMDILSSNKQIAIDKLTKIRKNITNGKYSAEEIAIPAGMSKEVGEYASTIPIWVRGAIYANNYFGENIIRDKVKYIYIKEKPMKNDIPKSNVISFTEVFPKELEIDYEAMAERLIDKPYKNILITLGYNIDVLKGQTTLFEW